MFVSYLMYVFVYWSYKLSEWKKKYIKKQKTTQLLFDLTDHAWVLLLWEKLLGWLEFLHYVFLSFGITLYLLFFILIPYEWGGKYLEACSLRSGSKLKWSVQPIFS